MLVRRLGSTLFWVFLVVSSILLFPVAVLIWAATVLFDRRLVAAAPLHLLLGLALHLAQPGVARAASRGARRSTPTPPT